MPDCSHCGRALPAAFTKCPNAQCGAIYDKREPEAARETDHPLAEAKDASVPLVKSSHR